MNLNNVSLPDLFRLRDSLELIISIVFDQHYITDLEEVRKEIDRR